MRSLLPMLLVICSCSRSEPEHKERSITEPEATSGLEDSGAEEETSSDTGVTSRDTGGGSGASDEAIWPGSERSDREDQASAMASAAAAFLASLDDYQRLQAQYELDHEERTDWSNLPHAVYARRGVSFSELNESRTALAWGLIEASLSAAGVSRAQAIIELEGLLWDAGDINANPGKYFFTFFGTPSLDDPWGWQLDGHHLALNFTVSGSEVTIAPSFWGAAPKTWVGEESPGLTPLADEEDLAFAWMGSLTSEQRMRAQLGEGLDPDLMAGAGTSPSDWPLVDGLPVSEMDAAQRRAVLDWIALFVGNLSGPQAAQRMHEVEASIDDVSVAWMGGTSVGDMMYYRIQGSRVLIEFDHSHAADHVHVVYRDPQNDYGGDWLRKHLALDH